MLMNDSRKKSFEHYWFYKTMNKLRKTDPRYHSVVTIAYDCNIKQQARFF